jgi:flavin reductase (DIM6/NTAB) family NADH-FMN oxidoreductase RutF
MTPPSSRFERILPKDIRRNPFALIADDWFLLTAGTVEKTGFNTMTASWGGLGELWRKKVAFVFVRPQRATRRFMDSGEMFSMSFFTAEYRGMLDFCGTHSGDQVDKVARTGLSPITPVPGVTAFEEADLILSCRKLYTQDLDPARFLDPSIESLYPEKGYHRLYVGEIVDVLRKVSSSF